jgi:hypothetical protein
MAREPTSWIMPQQLADQLLVAEYTVRRWVAEGRILGARRLPGGALRVPADSAAALLLPVSQFRVPPPNRHRAATADAQPEPVPA